MVTPPLPHRVDLCFLATSSPPDRTSSTTHGATTATTTWHGASCPRTSRPGERKPLSTSSSKEAWPRFPSNAVNKTLFAQSGRRELRVGEPEQRHQRLHWRGRWLHPPAPSGGAWLITDRRLRSLTSSY